MIDLNGFTKQEIELIEKLVDAKIKMNYRIKNGLGTGFGDSIKDKENDELMILKAKIINLKMIDK